MRTNKEIDRSIARKSFIVKIFLIFGSSHQKVFHKIGAPKMLATETAIFRKSYFERTPLASHLSLYYLQRPNQGRISNAFLTRIFCGI